MKFPLSVGPTIFLFNAKIIFIDHSTRDIALTLNPHLVSNKASAPCRSCLEFHYATELVLYFCYGAGQKRFKTLTNSYYRGARGIILGDIGRSINSVEQIEKLERPITMD